MKFLNLNICFMIILTLVSICSFAEAKKEPQRVGFPAATTQECTEIPYLPDAINSPYEMIFPVSKQRAKELIVDSATPLGFIFKKKLKDKISIIVKTQERSFKLPKGLEGHLKVKFKEMDTDKTHVWINTKSLELIGKSRDHSYAGAILKQAACLYHLFDETLVKEDTSLNISASGFDIPQGTEIKLVSARFISSRTVKKGDPIRFIVKENVVLDKRIIFKRGTTVWGEVTEARKAKMAGIKGKLSIAIKQIENTLGEKINVSFNADDSSKQLDGSRQLFTGFALPVAYVLASGAQPKIMAGSEYIVYVTNK